MNFYDEEIEIKRKEPNEREKENLSKVPVMDMEPVKHPVTESAMPLKRNESFDSDSDISRSDDKGAEDKALTTDKWDNLDTADDIKACFQYISKYIPQTLTLDYSLQPFIPEFVPAVGDVDAFLNVSYPDCLNPKKMPETIQSLRRLGLMMLDEPSGEQSEPNLLHVKLRSVLLNSKNSGIQPVVGKSSKEVDKWINEISELHIMHTQRNLSHLQFVHDIDPLMTEWPATFEQNLNKLGFPSPKLNCSLKFFIKLVCSIFDITIPENTDSSYRLALYTLFNLYLAINNEREDFKAP